MECFVQALFCEDYTITHIIKNDHHSARSASCKIYEIRENQLLHRFSVSDQMKQLLIQEYGFFC
jgi:hypothetical protein